MNPKYKEEITKDELKALPCLEYAGAINIVDTTALLKDMIQQLQGESMVGFDTESRPSFKKGVEHGVSLIQISTPQVSYLVRNQMIADTSPLVAFFEDKRIWKVGLSLGDDLQRLGKLYAFKAQNFIDLQKVVGEFGILALSLKKIAGIVLGMRISKGQQLSNWETKVLTDKQQQYAAIDAWAPYLIYTRLYPNRWQK